MLTWPMFFSWFLTVLTHLHFLLVEPDVKTNVGLLEVDNVEVVYKHIRKDGTKEIIGFHAAKVTLYS